MDFLTFFQRMRRLGGGGEFWWTDEVSPGKCVCGPQETSFKQAAATTINDENSPFFRFLDVTSFKQVATTIDDENLLFPFYTMAGIWAP